MTSVRQPVSESGRAAATRVAAALRTEAGLARLALGVAALHVVDDNFLQPQPGTSATDHLVSGLVPLGSDRRRRRPLPAPAARALRATLALLVRLFSACSPARRPATTRRTAAPPATTSPGSCRSPPGSCSSASAASTLWRSRRQGGSRAVAVRAPRLLLAVACCSPRAGRSPADLDRLRRHALGAGGRTARPSWGPPYEDVAFTTSDGLRLQGWYVPSKNGATVIAFPGRSGPQKQARMLVRHGYGVLLFDRRGEGESEGDPNGFGWGGERDLHAAARVSSDAAGCRPERIGGLGLSVGGEMADSRRRRLGRASPAVVSEGASGQSLRDELANPAADRLLDLPARSASSRP